MTHRTGKLIVALGALGLLFAAAVWLVGDYWAAGQTCLGGGGSDLLGQQEGSITIVDGTCQAVGNDGVVHQAALSRWDRDRPATIIAGLGAAAVVAGVTAPRYGRNRTATPESAG